MGRNGTHPVGPFASNRNLPQKSPSDIHLAHCSGLGLMGAHPAVNEAGGSASTFSALHHRDVKGEGDEGESGALNKRLRLVSTDAAGAGPP